MPSLSPRANLFSRTFQIGVASEKKSSSKIALSGNENGARCRPRSRQIRDWKFSEHRANFHSHAAVDDCLRQQFALMPSRIEGKQQRSRHFHIRSYFLRGHCALAPFKNPKAVES